MQKAFNAAKKRTKVATINDVLGKLPKNLQRKLQKVIDEELQQKQVEEEGAERAADGAEMAAESAGKSNLPSEGGAQGADMQGQQQSEHGGAPREAIPAAMATEAETAAVVKVQAVVRGRQARHPKEETPAERETRLAEEAAVSSAVTGWRLDPRVNTSRALLGVFRSSLCSVACAGCKSSKGGGAACSKRRPRGVSLQYVSFVWQFPARPPPSHLLATFDTQSRIFAA